MNSTKAVGVIGNEMTDHPRPRALTLPELAASAASASKSLTFTATHRYQAAPRSYFTAQTKPSHGVDIRCEASDRPPRARGKCNCLDGDSHPCCHWRPRGW